MSSVPPPPKLVAALRDLRKFLSPCNAGKPADMGTLFAGQLDKLSALCQDILPPQGAAQPLLAAAFRYIVQEGTVTITVPTLLRRLHSLAKNAGLLPSIAWQLIAIFAPFVGVALDDCESPDAIAAGVAFMEALAQARPCRALANTFAAANVATAGPARSKGVAQSGSAAEKADLASFCVFMGVVRLDVMRVSVLLLRHTLLCEPSSAALREDMAESRLAHHACDALTQLLTKKQPDAGAAAVPGALQPLIQAAQNLALAFINATVANQTATTDGAAAGAAWVHSGRCAALLATAAEPAFARMVVQALMRFAPAARLPGGDAADCGDNSLLALLPSLTIWLDLAECEGPATALQRISAVGITPLHVATLAMASAACSAQLTAMLVHKLYMLLPEEQQLGAYPAVAQHAGRLLDRLVERYRSGGAGDVAMRISQKLFPVNVDAGMASVAAVRLFSSSFSATPGLLQRSRCVLQLGLLSKTEALLRARASSSAPTAPASGEPLIPAQLPTADTAKETALAQPACLCAVEVAAALLGEPQRGPATLAIYQSLLATTRKLVEQSAQTAATTMAASGDHGASGSGPVGALPLHFLPCLALGSAVHPGASLQAQLAMDAPTHAAAARLAVRCCALQLLPLLMRGLSEAWALAAQAVCPPSSQEEACMVDLMKLLQWLPAAGLWDVSLAAGVPGALLELLRSQRTLGVGATPHASLLITRAAINTLSVSGAWDDWLREAGRLGLGEELMVWTQGAAGWKAAVQGDAGAVQVVQELMGMAAELSSKCQALPAVAADAVAPTWDSCALDTVAHATAAGLTPFLGCWHHGCTSMGGDSEAALRLLRCSNCGMARYCSVACQKEGWKGGHRSACNAWKAKQEGDEAVQAAATLDAV